MDPNQLDESPSHIIVNRPNRTKQPQKLVGLTVGVEPSQLTDTI
jgi:hypothetical protein